jgi:hypothetical protein
MAAHSATSLVACGRIVSRAVSSEGSDVAESVVALGFIEKASRW